MYKPSIPNRSLLPLRARGGRSSTRNDASTWTFLAKIWVEVEQKPLFVALTGQRGVSLHVEGGSPFNILGQSRLHFVKKKI